MYSNNTNGHAVSSRITNVLVHIEQHYISLYRTAVLDHSTRSSISYIIARMGKWIHFEVNLTSQKY